MTGAHPSRLCFALLAWNVDLTLAQPDVVISPQVLGGELMALVVSGEEVTPDFVMKHVFQRTVDPATKA